METCPQHEELSRQIESQGQTLHNIHDAVLRLDHGVNGTNGSIGLIKRVETIEDTVKQNKGAWMVWKELSGNLKFILRMGMWGCAALVGAQIAAKMGWII